MKVRAVNGKFADLQGDDLVELVMTVREMDELAGATYTRHDYSAKKKIREVASFEARDEAERQKLIADRPSFTDERVQQAMRVALASLKFWYTGPERAKCSSHFGMGVNIAETPMTVSIMRDAPTVVLNMPDRHWNGGLLDEWRITEEESLIWDDLLEECIGKVTEGWNRSGGPHTSRRVSLEKDPGLSEHEQEFGKAVRPLHG